MRLSGSNRNRLFKAGYFAKGTIYLLMGALSVATVVSASRFDNGPRAVIEWIGNNPLGRFFLLLTGLGLFAYCAWRWYKAVADTENEGHDGSGVIKRVAWAISGTTYGVLGVYAFNLFLDNQAGESKKQDAIGLLLEQPWGQLAVGLIGAIIAGVGLYQLYRALTDKHMEEIRDEGISQQRKEAFRDLGRLGLAARTVIYGIIAYFLFAAAALSDPSQFRGIGEALSLLRNGSYGAAMLAAVGTGFFAYGGFMFLKAKYERV